MGKQLENSNPPKKTQNAPVHPFNPTPSCMLSAMPVCPFRVTVPEPVVKADVEPHGDLLRNSQEIELLSFCRPTKSH